MLPMPSSWKQLNQSLVVLLLPAAGTYGIDASIPLTLNFINGNGGAAENVTLSSGSFDLTLDTGDEISNASISNSSTASFYLYSF